MTQSSNQYHIVLAPYSVFQVFSCERFDNGMELLRADYSIDCASDMHARIVIFAGFMIVLCEWA